MAESTAANCHAREHSDSMCGDEVMCQIGDKALVVEPTSRARASVAGEVSAPTYTSTRALGRLSKNQVLAVIGKLIVTLVT
jgi:hypothetical protein